MLLRHLTALFLVSLLAGNMLAGDQIPLARDPQTPVIELWYVDQGKLSEPEVSVFANGRVRVRVGEGSIWGQLDPRQLELLVQTLLQEDGLAALTTQSLQQAIDEAAARSGLSARIRDAGDTIIRIRTAQATYRIDGHAVGLLAARFPDVVPLQQLSSALRHIENVRAVVMVGGTPAAEKLASLAQAQLQAEYGERVIVGSQDLNMVRSLADGTRYCQFLVPSTSAATQLRVISLFESPGEAPRVSVLPNESRVQ